MSSKDNEEVLVVKTETLFPDGKWEGFREINFQRVKDLIEKEGTYLARKFAENDSTWQQIIPQIALISKKKIFIHRVPKTSNEGRLHDMWPIFIGGHINNFDGGIEMAAQREFAEEIDYEGRITKKTFLGLVKVWSPEVNAVHTGLVWVFEGDSENFKKTEDDGLVDGKFIEISGLESYMNKMSYWSKEVAPYIVNKYK